MTVTLAWDLSVEGADVLEHIERLGEDMTPVMDEVGEILVAAARRRIRESNVAPDGTPWKPSVRARREGGPTLYETGRLERGIRAQPRTDGVDVFNMEDHAAIHQFGGEIQRWARSQPLYFKYNRVTGAFMGFVRRAKSNFMKYAVIGEGKTTIPARPYLGVSKEDAAAVEAALIAHMRGRAP